LHKNEVREKQIF